MINKDFTIGILGGMGTYATIYLFEQYAHIFEAKKEWERPRIIIDNRCTMPSRVRAYMYEENVNQLVEQMADSIRNIIKMGGERVKIILACNTSHLFLPQIYELVPEAKDKIINLIDCTVDKIRKDNIKDIYLLGSEGTIESKVYSNKIINNGIQCIVPKKEDYLILRECIEAVKQNSYNEEIGEKFIMLMSRNKNVLLGCTELPILYQMYVDKIKNIQVYDPVLIALMKLRNEYGKL